MRSPEGARGSYSPRHCWVNFGSNRSPGIVLGWRRTEQGQWEAQVLYADGGGNLNVSVYMQWLPGSHVNPTDSSPGS